MSKGVLTIILVIIIAYSLSFIPLNGELINFDFIDNLLSQQNEPDEEPIEEIEPFVYELSLEDNATQLDNPGLVSILIETNDLEYTIDENLRFNLFQNNELINTFKNESMIIDIYDNKNDTMNQKKFTIDLSFGNLEISSGDYQLKVMSEDPALVDKEIILSLNYIAEYNYVGSSDTVPSGKQYLELYFADADYRYLVPVNRMMDISDRRIRETINAQYEGPTSASGLYEGFIGPWSYRAELHGDVLDIYYHSADIRPFEQGSSASMFAVDSIVNSLTSIPYVKSVQFFIDERIREVGFHDMVMNEPFEKRDWPVYYLGLYSSNDKVYLNPITEYELNYEEVFELLKGATAPSYLLDDPNIIFPIPMSVEKNAITLNNKVLTIDFNENAMTVFGDMNRNYQVMIDAILYSYTSFGEIDSVQILFEGKALSDFHGYDFTTPLKAPAYINLEP